MHVFHAGAQLESIISCLGSNSLLSYKLIDESGHFEIDTKTGIVFVKQEFTMSSEKQTINFEAEVSDSGDIPRVSVASLKVRLF